MDLARSEVLVGQLEESPERMPLYYGDLETMVATLMDDIYQLSLTREGNYRKCGWQRRSVGLRGHARSDVGG